MNKSETVQDYYTKVTRILNEIKTVGEVIDDSKFFEKILLSVLPKFDSIVFIIEETKEISSLSVPKLMGSLKAHEKRLAKHAKKYAESAFQSKLNFSSKSNE